MGIELMGEVFELGDFCKDVMLFYFCCLDIDLIIFENINKFYGEFLVFQVDGIYFNKKVYINLVFCEEFIWYGFWVNICIICYGDVVLMVVELVNELGKIGEVFNYLEMV